MLRIGVKISHTVVSVTCRFLCCGIANEFRSYFDQQFSLDAPSQLLKYEGYLRKHNNSLKRPHQNLVKEEIRLVQNYLQSDNVKEILEFLWRNRKMQLAAEDTVIKVSEKIKDIWHTLNRVEKAKASFTLAAFGDYTVHYLWIEELEAKGTTITAFVEMVATMTDDELITYLYNELSIYKRVDGIIGRYKILEDQQKPLKILIESELQKRDYSGLLNNEFAALISYFRQCQSRQFKVRRVQQKQQHKRSHLQLNIQCFLKVLGYTFERELTINNYTVDFLIKQDNKTGDSVQTKILEIYGAYHYTLTGHLRNDSIIRALILQNYAPIRLIHYNDYNKTNGHRNKMEYIRSVINMPKVNWLPLGTGYDSFWQLDSTYSQLK